MSAILQRHHTHRLCLFCVPHKLPLFQESQIPHNCLHFYLPNGTEVFTYSRGWEFKIQRVKQIPWKLCRESPAKQRPISLGHLCQRRRRCTNLLPLDPVVRFLLVWRGFFCCCFLFSPTRNHLQVPSCIIFGEESEFAPRNGKATGFWNVWL